MLASLCMPALFSVTPMDLHLFKEVFMPSKLQMPNVKRPVDSGWTTLVGHSLDDCARFVAHDLLRWQAVLQFAGAKPQ
jgi:hypothetical protein